MYRYEINWHRDIYTIFGGNDIFIKKMDNQTNENNIIVNRKYIDVQDSNQNVDLIIYKPEKLSENKYKCVYSFIGKLINLSFPTYGYDSFQALVLAIFNANITSIANNLNPSICSDEEDLALKTFCDKFMNCIQHTIKLK